MPRGDLWRCPAAILDAAPAHATTHVSPGDEIDSIGTARIKTCTLGFTFTDPSERCITPLVKTRQYPVLEIRVSERDDHYLERFGRQIIAADAQHVGSDAGDAESFVSRLRSRPRSAASR